MKRFSRRQEDIHQPRQPKLSEVVKAIEDAWSDYTDAPITIKNGDIRVRYSGERSASYKFEPKLHFSDGACYWTVESWGSPRGRDKIVIGARIPCPIATCTIPHMGDFHGLPEDIAKLEAAAEELRRAYAKIQDLLDSEVEQ